MPLNIENSMLVMKEKETDNFQSLDTSAHNHIVTKNLKVYSLKMSYSEKTKTFTARILQWFSSSGSTISYKHTRNPILYHIHTHTCSMHSKRRTREAAAASYWVTHTSRFSPFFHQPSVYRLVLSHAELWEAFNYTLVARFSCAFTFLTLDFVYIDVPRPLINFVINE